MKNIYVTILFIAFLYISNVNAQGVGINTTGLAPDTSAILDVSSTNKGLLIPRLTTAQRATIPTPANGLLIYNLDISCYQYFDGSTWLDLCGEQKEKPLLLPWRPGLPSANDALKNMYQDKYVIVSLRTSDNTFSVLLNGLNIQTRGYTSDWATANLITSGVVIDSSLYVLMLTSSGSFPYRVYRYDLYNINNGGMLVSFVGLSLSSPSLNTMIMTSNGTDIYFNYNAGNSGNDYVIAHYSITSSTVFTYQNSITCGSTAGSFQRIIVDNSGNLYGGAQSTTNMFVKHNSSGIFMYQSGQYNLGNNNRVLNWDGTFYLGESVFGHYMKFLLQ